ncbi:Flap endonuclease GEN 1 [Hypsizygus marmoreus]|uniref:Flap endonuclease GEN 1 n=1 Tax=Hypsizygus marmoreus TaxID=39966 RepID=A0A369JG79_HYPMA|nr:Flap endonuclease GEN 1 [Hypsizygus marmoreus]
MGVAGLWDVLHPAGKTRSLTELSVTEGFIANPDGVRGFRIGIDASIWFFHAEYGREGENPVLRTLFFRCATLMHSPFLPLFVFDGPKRPDVKRGKKINRTSHKLIPGMKAIVEAFGFEWRMAPGEAEAELAYLNRIGVIDGILSDDVDNFLFGAITVIRNASNNLSGNRANPVVNAAGKDDKNHTKVYRLTDITAHPDVRLTRGGMILIGLMSGGDYQQGGLSRCGTVTSHGLAKCGFGDTLFEAAKNLSRENLKTFLVHWRHELCHELRTNSQGHIGRKQVALANSVPAEFPDIDILLSYTNPITSESMGRAERNLGIRWEREPDLGKLAATCEFYFEWGYREAIIKRFRTVIWHSAVLRILRRAVLDLDKKRKGVEGGTPETPRKAGKKAPECVGTPSKMIAKHFSTMTIRADKGDVSEDDDDDEAPLIVKIHSERNHVSTDGLLEYRLEIAPAQLVRIAESGINGTRSPDGPDEWADEEDEEEGGEKGTKKPPPDPRSHMRVWMPACMVRLVEPRLVEEFEGVQERKREKKAGKGKGKTAGKTKATPIDEDEASEEDHLPVVKPFTKAPSKTKALPISQERCEGSPQAETETRPARVVRDLTKKKTSAKPKHTPGDLKAFFVVAKPSTIVKGKATMKGKSVMSKAMAEELEESSEDDLPVSMPVFKAISKDIPPPRQDSASVPGAKSLTGHRVARDLTKKVKPRDLPMHKGSTKLNTLFSSSKPPPGSKGKAPVSLGLSYMREEEEEESDTSLRMHEMLSTSPSRPNPLTSWSKQPIHAYLPVSDESDFDDCRAGTSKPKLKAKPKPVLNLQSAMSSLNDSFLYDSDEPQPRSAFGRVPFQDDSHLYDSDDPFGDTPPRPSSKTPPSPRQGRKKKSLSPSDSDTFNSHLNKSPRKSSDHTSPRKRPPSARKGGHEIDKLRPPSPSPLQPSIPRGKPVTYSSSSIPPMRVIEISDSSDDEGPLKVPAKVPPLLLARARMQSSGDRAPMKQISLYNFTGKKPTDIHISSDIIDLT